MPPFPKLKLVYFDFGGRAEATRLTLFVGGIPFEDIRVGYCDGFSRTAESAPYPYRMLPVLEVDGTPIAESMAMLRFAGRLTGLYPVNDAAGALLIDEILELVEVFTERCLRWEREADAAQQRQLEHELTTEIIPQSFYAIDAKLAALKAHPTFSQDPAPLFVHEFVLCAFIHNIIHPDWEKYVSDRSKISHWLTSMDKVKNHPQVKLYYALQRLADEKELQLTDGDRNVAEPIRMALRMGKIAFEDRRVPGQDKPMLKTGNGRVISSYFAILRYAGDLAGLYPAGRDTLLSFRVDELLGQLEELQNWWYYPSYTAGDEAKQQAFARQLSDKTIPKFLAQLETRVGSWAGPYATGSALTIADLAIHGVVTQLTTGSYLRDAPPVSMAQYKSLEGIHGLVERAVSKTGV